MQFIKNLFSKYPLYLILFLLSLVVLLDFLDEKILLEIQHPPKSEYPWLYFINNIYENSTITSGIFKVLYDKLSWICILSISSLYFIHLYKQKEIFVFDYLYLILLLILKMVSYFYLDKWKNILEIFDIPFILILYSYLFHFLFCFYNNHNFYLKAARDFFLKSYGKIFFFLFILNLGIESLPFNELDIYSNKYGVDTAWKIISYRNLIFDILFFALVWSYMVYISFFKEISFVNSFLSLNKILQAHKWRIFKFGFIYYLFIAAVTIIDFYLEIKNWKLLFSILIHFLFLERMYKLFKEYFQSLGKENAERTKSQRPRRKS